MSDAAPQAPASWQHVFRLRALAVTIESQSPAIHAAAACLVNRAEEQEETERAVHFRLFERAGDGVEVVENHADRFRTRAVPDALALVHRRLGTHLHGVYERYTFLHAGAVTIDGRLVVIAGRRGAGKTTLLLKLALDGAAFHCDEYVTASRDGLARTVPRRLHVKPGTLACLPSIDRVCRGYPMLVLDGGLLFFPLDVADLGIPWRSADARPSAIVHLTPAFDEPPAVTPIAQIESVRRLMHEAQIGDLAFGRQAGDICGVVRGVPCFEVRVGPIDATAEEIRRIATKLPCAEPTVRVQGGALRERRSPAPPSSHHASRVRHIHGVTTCIGPARISPEPLTTKTRARHDAGF